MCRTLLNSAILSLMVIPCAHSQTPPRPATANPQSTSVLTTAEEISLDLIVRDKKGRRVSDLKPSDIQITDDGSPVKVSDLRLVSASSDHMVTLLFDRLEPGPARSARAAAFTILKMAPANGIAFTVLKVDARLRLFQEFTTDREALKNAVEAATGAPKTDPQKKSSAAEQMLLTAAAGSMDSQDRVKAQITLAALQESQRIVEDQHARPSLAGLLALARAERKLPGRKTIIYFAQGLQADSNSRDLVRSIIGTANRAGVSIYSIDANALDEKGTEAMMAGLALSNASAAGRSGLGGVPASSSRAPPPIDTTPPGMKTMAQEQMARIEISGRSVSQNALAELSAGTGGMYIATTDQIRKPIRRMIEDMSTYYEVSYAPSIQKYDGRFRSVSVNPTRRGLVIQARTGYFALPPASPVGIRPFEASLLKVLSEPQPPTELQFRSEVLRLGKMPDGNASSLILEVPLSDVDIHPDPNTNLFSVHLSMLARIKDKSGTVIDTFSEDLPRHGALEAQERARSEIVTFERHFTAAPGQYTLETAVIDRNSGNAGAQRMNFEIPPEVANGPAISDVSLVRRTDGFNADADPFEPLQFEARKVIPNISGRVPPDASDISLFFLLHPDPHASSKPKLEIEVRKDGEPIGRVPLQVAVGNGQGPIPYMASIRSTSLPGGTYEAVVILTQGGQRAERSTSFTLAGPDLASSTVGSHEMPGAAIRAGNASVSDSDTAVLGNPPPLHQRLEIVPHRGDTLISPPEDAQALIESARERAMDYSAALPNFSCLEVTGRFIDPSGADRWRHKDTIAEILRYHDNTEQRVTLEVNGIRSQVAREDLKGTISHGEFGGLLNSVFNPSAKADFQWKETDTLGTGTVQVFTYRVALRNSTFMITADNGRRLKVGFHGLVYIDSATRGVRRLTLEADGIDPEFPIHAASFMVDYDYLAIGDHDYLLPITGQVKVTQGKRTHVLNEMEFRDYRRFAAESSLRFDASK